MKCLAPLPLPFFVYGTLLPGQPNEELWEGSIINVETAFLDNSCIYDMGFYPMLVSQNDGVVTGKLITVYELAYEKILSRLDALEEFDPSQPERSTYLRRQRRVRTITGREANAWVYEGDLDLVNEMSQIASGDWLEHVHSRQIEIETWWAAINTMFGHHKQTDGED